MSLRESTSQIFSNSSNMIQTNLKSRWWTELAWRLYERLPAAADDVLKWRFRYALLLRNSRIPVVILRGSTRPDGHPVTVVLAGDRNSLDSLVQHSFENMYQQETVGTVPPWNLARTLKRLRASADLTVAFVDQLSARLFFGKDYMAVPVVVGSMLTVPEDFAELTRGNESLKNDLRTIRRNNLKCDITHSNSDFEAFYHTMFVPFIRKRYGAQGVIYYDFHQMRRIFYQGGLFLIRLDKQPIAGLLFQQRDQQLRSVALGTTNGEWEPVKLGAFLALYTCLVEHAKAVGCKFVDFGGSHPSLNDGVLRYKRKWGANLVEEPDIYYDFLVYWNRLNKPVTSFLSSTPLIFRDRGGLSAIYVIDQDEPVTQIEARKAHRFLWMPGLKRLYLVATSGWQPGISNPPQTHLISLNNTKDFNPGTILLGRQTGTLIKKML